MKKECKSYGKFGELIKDKKIPLSPVVKANGFVFVSGLPPYDNDKEAFTKGDIQAQTRMCLENLKMALEAAGSSMDKVVKCTVLAVNAGTFNEINEVYAEYFENEPPARTFINVASWPLPFDVEIECIALE
jgi:2-iminobutanoate/2-iminopropanoate deaminase